MIPPWKDEKSEAQSINLLINLVHNTKIDAKYGEILEY